MTNPFDHIDLSTNIGIKNAGLDAETGVNSAGANLEVNLTNQAELHRVFSTSRKNRIPGHNPYAGTSKEKLFILLGENGVERLSSAHVLVLGCGGVGSNCAEALARAGIGRISLYDHDVVSASNINRQAIAFHSTIGRPKVEVLAAMIKDINPNACVHAYQAFVGPENLEEVLGGDFDYIVDAIDTVSSKLAIAKYAYDHKLPLVASTGMANKRDPLKLEFADLFDTCHDSLCRIMRKEARKRAIGKLEVLYSSELGCKISTDGSKEARHARDHLGTMSYMPPIAGQMLASYVVRKLMDWPLV